MSKEIRKELKIIPAQVKIVEHIRYVYACRTCEKDNISTPIITAKMPKPVLVGSFVSPSLLAYIMNRKYSEAILLYRQEQQFNNFGIDLSRQNLANWVIHGSNNWLQYIYDRLHENLLKETLLHADETTIQVLDEEGKKPTSKSYMCLYVSGRDCKQIFLYEYQASRASKHPKEFLEEFKGYFQTDGYPRYNKVSDVIQVGCFSHARRKFTDALKSLPKDSTTTKTNAQEGLDYCNELFKIERLLKNLTPEERYKKCLEQSKPVLEAFLSWLKIKVHKRSYSKCSSIQYNRKSKSK